MPHTEVLIVNYNGAHFLEECLAALSQVETNGHTLDVSVVDNGSVDNSEEVVCCHKGVHFIKLGKNYGFSKGNNLGAWERLKQRRLKNQGTDYFCFLNNDTKVEPYWLSAAMERFASNPSIGVVGSKACFYDRFIELTFSCSNKFSPSESGSSDSRDLGVFLAASSTFENIHKNFRRTKWLDSYAPDNCGGRWLKPEGRILFAVENGARSAKLNLNFQNLNQRDENITLTLGIGQQREIVTFNKGEAKTISLSVSTKDYKVFIQNAGSFVTSNWDGGDEGSFVADEGNYEEPRELAAVCGVSLFIKADLFERLGGFDEDYFAYYEDTDLSLRARIRNYSCWYEPRSRLRHVHCGSGGEYSPYFNFNVTHSHLLFVSRWMRGRAFYNQLCRVVVRAWREFKEFETDLNIETKPNLRTLMRCIKHPLRLPRNRFYRFVHGWKIRRLKTDELRKVK
jgi:GT2 family glycosyltransferase